MGKLILPSVVMILVVVIFIILLNKVTKKVLQYSEKLDPIAELNKTFSFHDLNPKIRVDKHYDNKGKYTRIEPAFVMSAHLKENIVFFSQFINEIKDNRKMHKDYNDKIASIISQETAINFKEIKTSKFLFLWREKQLIKRKIIKPILDCKFCVFMTYTSHKKQVNLKKHKCFNFNDVFTSFESISRTYLDKETRDKLILVERGEISDSLRYDILYRDNFRCLICGASAKEGVRLHVDHIMPVSKGGKSNIENLRTLCERCNIGKSNKIEN